MNKILVCGVFDFKDMATGGQPVKTRELFYALRNKFGEKDVDYLELLNWKKHPIALFCDFFKKSRNADGIIMLPAHNGVLVFSYLLLLARAMYHCNIFYDVIGGWLPDLLKTSPRLAKRLLKFNGIWTETSSMKNALNGMGFNNVTVLNNFKTLTSLQENELASLYSKPYRLCTFSRIMEEKGIEDAINAVTEINESAHEVVYELDNYGPIDERYASRFSEVMDKAKPYIRYKGCARPEQSVETIKDYFALLFPTHFFTEGIPGTIIDAYCAGVPVISAKWQNSADVVQDGKTGYLYKFNDYDTLVKVLSDIKDNPDMIISLKKECVSYSHSYTPEVVIEQIVELIKM